ASAVMPSAAGLTAAEAARRAHALGPNTIVRESGPSSWAQFAVQFNSPLIWLLAVACAVAAALGEAADAIAILAIVVLNGAIGFFQERGAARAIEALGSLTAPRARVRRDGRAVVVPASEVVAGDLLLLEAGDVVAADARLVETHNLAASEAA